MNFEKKKIRTEGGPSSIDQLEIPLTLNIKSKTFYLFHSQLANQHRAQQMQRAGNPNMAAKSGKGPPQQGGQQPPRNLLQQIQAARMMNNQVGGQPQTMQAQQPPMQGNVLQGQAPPPYPGPPPPYPGNNTIGPVSSINDQVRFQHPLYFAHIQHLKFKYRRVKKNTFLIFLYSN